MSDEFGEMSGSSCLYDATDGSRIAALVPDVGHAQRNSGFAFNIAHGYVIVAAPADRGLAGAA